jgi:alkyl hydroperoxide reductase subunit AhpC
MNGRRLMSAQDDRQQAGATQSALLAGTPAPDFTLPSTPDQKLSLTDFRGSPVILAFYPADWSPVCGDQMSLYNEVLPEFRRYGLEFRFADWSESRRRWHPERPGKLARKEGGPWQLA